MTEDELHRLYVSAISRRRRSKRSGEETELIYRVMAGTGLRSDELASILVVHVNLNRCEILLKAGDEKAKRGARQPFKQSLGMKIADWMQKQNKQQKDFLFDFTPQKLLTSFEADYKHAGIERCGDDGRTLDVHCLRRTYGTLMARAGVPLTTVQRLMRHSTPELTAKLYIDVEPIDIADALKKLPD